MKTFSAFPQASALSIAGRTGFTAQDRRCVAARHAGRRLPPTGRKYEGIYRPKSALNQWEFQDPKMEVLFYIRPYFVGIVPEI